MGVRLVERFDGGLANGRVDTAAGVVRGVLLCGAESKNGRSYPASLWPKSIGLYANVPIHADHGRERRVGDRIGWVSNPRVVDGRPRGDANFLTSHPLVPPILEMCEKNPTAKWGFSHVCVANTRRVGGKELVESIEKVEAVDFVADPATVAGMYESVQRGQAVTSVAKSAAMRVLEGIQATAPAGLRGSLRRVLVELDSKNYADAVGNAFLVAGHAVWTSLLAGEMTLNDAIDKFRKLHKGHAEGGGSSPDGTTESRQVLTGAAFAESLRTGYVPTGRVPTGPAFAESLRHGCVVTEADHAAFLRSIRS